MCEREMGRYAFNPVKAPESTMPDVEGDHDVSQKPVFTPVPLAGIGPPDPL